MLVFSSMAAALLVGVPAGILLSRPGMQAQAERLMQVFNVATPSRRWRCWPSPWRSASARRPGDPRLVPRLAAADRAQHLRGPAQCFAGAEEAATGIGMTPNQVLLRVELPNAVPIIVGGVRVALALNVGSAPLAFPDRRQQPGQPDLPRHLPEQPPATAARRRTRPPLLLDARSAVQPHVPGTRPDRQGGLMNRRSAHSAWPAPACSPPAWRRRKPCASAARPSPSNASSPPSPRSSCRSAADVTVTTGLAALARAAQESGQLDIVWGVHRLVADRLQPHRRSSTPRLLPPGQATRRSPGPGLAEADPLQQHLCPGHARGTGRAPGHPERQRSRGVLAEQQEAEPGSTHRSPWTRSSPAAPTASAP